MKPSVEQEIERILPFIPTTPPEDTLEIVKARGYLNDQRLLYGCEWVYDESKGKKVRKVKVVCTECGGEEYLDYVQSGCGRYGATWGFIDAAGDAITAGSCCICPCCHRGTTAMERPYTNHKTKINDHAFMSIHKVEGYLVVLSWVITKLVDHYGVVSYRADRYEGAVLIDKTIVRIRGFFKFMTSYRMLDHWEYTQRFDYQFESFSRDEVIYAEYCETDGTLYEKSGFVPYLKGEGRLYPMEYMKLWLKHPNVENLVTAGFDGILADILYEAVAYRYYNKSKFDIKKIEGMVNFKKVKPLEMLGITRDELPILQGGGFERLNFYHTAIERCGVKLNTNQLHFCKKLGYHDFWTVIDTAEACGHKVKLLHMLNYLAAQADKQKGAYEKTLVNALHLRDYWSMVHKVYGSLPEELIYPKDLRKAHDDIQTRVDEIENEAVDAAIKARVTELSRFTLIDADAGLMIRPAGSYREFINEGKKLNHCVARYAETHSKGNTNIFFIRKIDEPDKPYYTLELDVDFKRVLQNRGKSNCARTEEVTRFEAAWLEHIKEIIKKEKSNGKRNRKSGNAERIGA
jgi:hypothetical protein